jgi:hypothetical protein
MARFVQLGRKLGRKSDGAKMGELEKEKGNDDGLSRRHPIPVQRFAT